MSKFNPFNPNSVVVPNLFAGRYKQVKSICSKLERLNMGMGANFFVHGERGIGKTALAKLILYIARANDPQIHGLNLLTSYYTVEKGQTIGSVLQESLNKLTEGVDKTLLDTIGTHLGGLVKNGKFQIGAFGIGLDISAHETDKDIYTIKDQSVSILGNLIRGVCNGEGQNKKDGVLIVIDEIHNINDIISLASILRNISTTLDVDGVGRVSFLLIGYDEDMVKFFEEDSSSKRSFDPVKLDVMPDEEAADVLKKGFDSIGATYDESLIIKNIKTAGGYPHSIQILGHNIVETDNDNDINEEDWDEAIFHTAYELRTKDFSKMFSFNKPLKVRDQILIALADASDPLSRKELDDLVESSIYQHIDTLKKSGAIKEDEDKRLTLSSQLFKTAIRIDQLLRMRKGAQRNEA